jgi:predicted helicase
LSQFLIQKYLNQLATLKRVSGTHRETVVREAFKDLLKAWGRSEHLEFVPEYQFETKMRDRRYADGALLHTLRVPFGYWEAKDSDDDLDEEITKKFRAGYPKTNIIFEDSTQAVLFQNGEEVIRCRVEQTASLEKLLKLFFGYERPEIEAFRKAVEQFKTDLPNVLNALRSMISGAYDAEAGFRYAASEFLTHAKGAINPNLVDADVREMLIQHILTGEVFDAVFPGTTFHEDNNVARELHKLEATFFTGNTKFQTLRGLEPYYAAIRKAASQISTHSEKQTFLKAIYENFYKVYNPKAADRLGVVYTPNEIVHFMVESADWLCEQHFQRNLIDDDVDILDPATGTGTFICEMIEHFSGQPDKLSQKYLHSIHANEVAILPYYVANLNIEATYAAATGNYVEFPGLCFVDTLDNIFSLRKYLGDMDDMFGSVADDNVKRIRNQNNRRISVILGNPPYNANQLNENQNNKNRAYKEIDKRIKQTYIKESTAQKTKVYDMYSRFFRWASDRLDENGILAFITNRSFIDKRTFDGFRSVVAKDFSEIRVLDLGGDVRSNPKLNGGTHNVFGIQTGVAISFMVRRGKQQGCRIFYARRPEMETAEEKLSFLSNTALRDISFEEVKPDQKHNWINQTNNDFDSLLPLATKEAKATKKAIQANAIFKLFSLGVVTARDEWVYDRSRSHLCHKVSWLIDAYNADLAKLSAHRESRDLASMLDNSIKWSRAVKNYLRRGTALTFDSDMIIEAVYRPFVKEHLCFDKKLNEMQYQLGSMFRSEPNPTIAFLCAASANLLAVMAVEQPFDYCLLKMGNGGTQAVSFWYYSKTGERHDNITDWALECFTERYPPTGEGKDRPITKSAIFQYVYGVLHDPSYRETYALNLKREFPRIPFYADFWVWSDFGSALADLHLGYENARLFPLKRSDVADDRSRKLGLPPKAFLRVDKAHGIIQLDSETTLAGVPSEAWEYRLANRSALEWVLDQYKEKKPKDPTIRENFNTYRFADYKEAVVNLLMRVTTVSVETVQIIRAMKLAPR